MKQKHNKPLILFIVSTTLTSGLLLADPIFPVSAVASSHFRDNSADLLIDSSGFEEDIFFIEDSFIPEGNNNFATSWVTDSWPGSYVDFDLGGTFDVTDSHVWNYSQNNEGVPNSFQIGSYQLTFSSDSTFDASDSMSSVFNLAAVVGEESDNTGSHENFTAVPNVSHIRLSLVSRIDGNASGFGALSEVRFGGIASVPEPSSTLLLGLASLALLKRRRK